MNDDFLRSLLGPDTRPNEVRAIAVMTADGQASVSGTSQSLGSDTDAQLLQELRRWADVIVVGSRTVRAENYGGAVIPESVQRLRESRRQQPNPPVAVISRSLDLDPESRLFRDTAVAPLILTDNDDPAKQQALRDCGADIIEVRDGNYIAALQSRGYGRLSVEGGPGIYARLLGRGEIDKFYLTVDPTMALHSERPLLHIADDVAAEPVSLNLEHCAADDSGCVFLRYSLHR